ncbi:MAG TPA: NAD(P)/FAD-dependent oxidoreductase [Streptosporangiaceae bacterium]|nr:NAD(P)/FAD-dependent oxidoreductase [Streptosporangiaceae bacterium]
MSARRRRPPEDATRVIVVGAGFAGLAAVAELHRAGARVMLVDRNIYSTFQPLLYQVATGGLNPGDVAFPLSTLAYKRAARFRPGQLAGIDPAARTVTLTDGTVLDYDYLVLGTGVSAAHYGVTGAAEHTFGLYTRRDAVALRDHIMARLERLDIEGPGKTVNFTVVGGGATGVELAGALAELRALDTAFPGVDRADVRIRLVEMAPALLAPFHPKLQAYALEELRRRDVDVHLDTKIKEITEDRVILESGDELPSDVTVWAAGVSAPAEVTAWGLPQGRGGRVQTGPDLRVSGQDRIFATGDIALIEGQPLPQLAQPAIQAGRHAGKQIARLMTGRPTEPFHYHDKGIMATIGRRSAVVELARGMRLRGTLAWLAWLALHLVYLLGGRNRLSALLNLSYRYLIWGHGGGVIVGDDPPATLPGGPPQAVPGAAAGSAQPPR